MRAARIIVLVVALVAGIAAAFLAMNVGRRPTQQQQAAAVQPTIALEDVLVATKDIPIGHAVTGDAVAWRAWPKEGLVSGYLTRSDRPNGLNEVTGTIARASFAAGEPITEPKLVRSDRGYLSAILPSGKRAVATTISADTSAGGFILPNDRVDVIMTRPIPAPQGQPDLYQTETILQNVRVLAIDQTIEDKNGEKVVVGQTATLELSPQQAEVLTVAKQMAANKLTLALRSLADAAEAGLPEDVSAARLARGNATNGNAVTLVRNGITKQITVGK